MKLLDTTGKTLKKAAAAVVKAVTPSPATQSRDPWNYGDARQAAINGRDRWLGRRRGRWLR